MVIEDMRAKKLVIAKQHGFTKSMKTSAKKVIAPKTYNLSALLLFSELFSNKGNMDCIYLIASKALTLLKLLGS